MTPLVRPTALLLCLVALGGCFFGSSAQRAWRQGQNQARTDLAAGRAVLRVMNHPADVYAFVDAETGLPTEDWSLHCGTGVDFAAYEARIEGYNDVVRDALAGGELDGRLLSHKLRTRERAEADFRAATPHDWSESEPVIGPDGGPYRLELRRKGGYPDLRPFIVATSTGVARDFPFYETVQEGGCVAFVDDGTTLMIRRPDGAFVTWDLATGCAIQLIGPAAPDPDDR